MSRWARRIPALLTRVLVLLAVACLLAGAGPAAAQAEGIPWEYDWHGIRWVLKNLGFQPLESLGQCSERPENKIVLVLGETGMLDGDGIPGGVRAFVEKGGALLVATDRSRSRRPRLGPDTWENEFGVEVIDEAVVVQDPRSRHAYLGLGECPIIRPRGNSSPILRGLSQGLAANCPGQLRLWRPADGAMLSVMADFPEGCRPERPGLFTSADPPVFAAGRDWGKGRILVLADHSVFINDMMLQDDNDNIAFASNCLRWLREGPPRDGQPPRRRSHVLLIEEGVIRTKFDVPAGQPPLPPPGPWVNQLLHDMEREDLFNQALLDRVRPGQLLRAMLLALTAWLLLYGLARLQRARHRAETGALPLALAVHRQASGQTVVEQRHQDMLRRDNLWEPARTLARQCFESIGEPAAPAAASMPRVTAAGSWWQQRRLRRRVHRLWQLAFGPGPVRVTASEFAGLAAEVANIRAAMAGGTLELRPASIVDRWSPRTSHGRT